MAFCAATVGGKKNGWIKVGHPAVEQAYTNSNLDLSVQEEALFGSETNYRLEGK